MNEINEINEQENMILEGRNAITEALRGGRPIDKILVKSGDVEGSIRALAAKAKDAGILVSFVPKAEIDRLSETGRHQGIVAICAAHEYATLEGILNLAKERREDPFVIILDGVTDPHNLGAIIRSAEAAGAHGVVIPKRRSASLTAVVMRVSAGAAEHLPVARVTNISNTIKELKKNGVWVAAATMDGQIMYEANLTGPLALVVGGEDSGVSRLVADNCDFLVNIPMKGKIGSLNASVAAAVLMFEVLRRRQG
ncbi:MAG: 23S rRNA (guanosine(2251)-2'-O)-methyltransferase RlmB [Defluviitaleaceae bacterium]|nr:23S rRNA (guanosine(2251)-2'-O)-methyltransferase RlmB [Defluviitaleaceae bacterium]